MAVVVVIAAVSQVDADPIRFDNPPGPNHFTWYGGAGSERIGLDVTDYAANQTGAYGGIACFAQSNELPSLDRVVGPVGGGLEVGGYADYFLVGVDDGDCIPSGAPWRQWGFIHHPDYGSWLPAGETAYLGLRFPLAEGGPLHYGWIGVQKFVADDGSQQLDTFAWGYNDVAGEPIPGFPEPGTLAMLALGAALVGGRRG